MSIFTPGSWPHTITGGFSLLLLIILLALLFLGTGCVGETKYHSNIKDPTGGRYHRVQVPRNYTTKRHAR